MQLVVYTAVYGFEYLREIKISKNNYKGYYPKPEDTPISSKVEPIFGSFVKSYSLAKTTSESSRRTNEIVLIAESLILGGSFYFRMVKSVTFL